MFDSMPANYSGRKSDPKAINMFESCKIKVGTSLIKQQILSCLLLMFKL